MDFPKSLSLLQDGWKSFSTHIIIVFANDYKFSAKIKRGLLCLNPFFNPYLWNGYPLLSLPGEFG